MCLSGWVPLQSFPNAVKFSSCYLCVYRFVHSCYFIRVLRRQFWECSVLGCSYKVWYLVKSAYVTVIKNILTRRKESDTYLSTVSRHRLESADNDENRSNVVAFSQHCDLHQLKKMSSSSADEGHSAGWKLLHLIYFHHYLQTPVISTDSSQVGVALFPSC